MNRMFRLGPVLRARKAQEDAARGSANQSGADVRNTKALVKRRQLDLVGRDAPTEGSARAMVAVLVARQSVATRLAGAHRMVDDAEQVEREQLAELVDAAKHRRAGEIMAQRHAESVRTHDLTVDQAAVDERAVTSKGRKAARGTDGVSQQRANSLRTGGGSRADRVEP